MNPPQPPAVRSGRNHVAHLAGLLPHFPWLAGVLLAPLLYGGLRPWAQAVMAALFGVSLLSLAGQIGRGRRPLVNRWLLVAFAAAVLLPVVPLPIALVEWIHPTRALLAREFPVTPGTAPAWVPLTCSTSDSAQRLWELALVACGFVLARAGAASPAFPRALLWTITSAAALLVASEVWRRADGRGLWHIPWATAAGTFTNRNHFANWLVVASLFCAGWWLRQRWPLISARLGPPPPDARAGWTDFALLLAVLGALVAAVMTGCRGAFVALLVGLAFWAGLLALRAHNRVRAVVAAVAGVTTLAVVVACGGLVFARLAGEGSSLPTKLRVWDEALRVGAEFPWLGAGVGAFRAAFGHLKTIFGEYTVWHAENEYVQGFLELGAVGALLAALVAAFGGRLLARFVRREAMPEPELVFGAVAALAAFAVQAGVEFVAQIPANALLAAVLLGFVAGVRDRVTRPLAPAPVGRRRWAFNLGGALVVLAGAVLQGVAAWHWHQAQSATGPACVASLERAVAFWPWTAEMQLALARARAQAAARTGGVLDPDSAAPIFAGLDRAIAADPLNWELRLERAWLGLGVAPKSAMTRADIAAAVNLNPLQPKTPLALARAVAAADREFALEILRAIKPQRADDVRAALAVAWEFDRRASTLWTVTPASEMGLLALGDFAVEQKLFPLATQAYAQLVEQLDPLLLAEKFLNAGRADLALPLLPREPGTARERLLWSRAELLSGNFAAAIRHAEALWSERGLEARLQRSLAAGRGRSGGTLDLGGAERIYEQPAAQRDLARLRAIADQFPGEPRLIWMVFQTELELRRYEPAARRALQLATLLAAQ
jgi:O-antigen ligase